MYKFYICAAIFIILSAVKFLAPQHTENLREQVLKVIDTNEDYPAIVEAMGKRISQHGLGEEIIRVLDMNNEELKAAVKEQFSEAQEAFSENR